MSIFSQPALVFGCARNHFPSVFLLLSFSFHHHFTPRHRFAPVHQPELVHARRQARNVRLNGCACMDTACCNGDIIALPLISFSASICFSF
ncbi:MAG TPA: hypothetical protein PLJ84_11995 [Bacteroidales bacterium]|nr:hypothetical protein [Bacteroidales bacterium]